LKTAAHLEHLVALRVAAITLVENAAEEVSPVQPARLVRGNSFTSPRAYLPLPTA
jgi:hypothetical protein